MPFLKKSRSESPELVQKELAQGLSACTRQYLNCIELPQAVTRDTYLPFKRQILDDLSPKPTAFYIACNKEGVSSSLNEIRSQWLLQKTANHEGTQGLSSREALYEAISSLDLAYCKLNSGTAPAYPDTSAVKRLHCAYGVHNTAGQEAQQHYHGAENTDMNLNRQVQNTGMYKLMKVMAVQHL